QQVRLDRAHPPAPQPRPRLRLWTRTSGGPSVMQNRSWLRPRLRLEQLEQRWTPANYFLIGSTLFVSNLSGPAPTLTAVVNANNTITGTDDGGTPITFAATNLDITGTNPPDTTTATGGGRLAGNLVINSGNGNDLVSITPAGIGGNVLVNTGFGNDTLVESTAVGGLSLLSDPLGTDTALVLGSQGGLVSLTGLHTVTPASTAGDSVFINSSAE